MGAQTHGGRSTVATREAAAEKERGQNTATSLIALKRRVLAFRSFVRKQLQGLKALLLYGFMHEIHCKIRYTKKKKINTGK